MSIEERFHAAVNVIRNLPKNGPYQPSNDMMLRFYSFFKQSTEGPCVGRRPSFWDLVNRAKYDAWKRLGDMPKEEAMELYVIDLQKIVETMSYTVNVANFMDTLQGMDNITVEDLELVAPEFISKIRADPNSPFNSREQSPMRKQMEYSNGFTQAQQYIESQMSQLNGHSHTNGFSNGHHSTDESDDEYIDTVEEEISTLPIDHIARRREKKSYSHMNGSIPKKSYNSQPLTDVNNTALITQLTNRMSLDMENVNKRISAIEQKINDTGSTWWPLQGISPNWFMVAIVWPFAVQMIFRLMQRQRGLGGGVKRS